MELQYKTRSGSDKEGKPRVYFSCHPEDFEEAFKVISDDILEQANCVVWYDPDLSEMPDTEELFAAMEEMQLIVFAVSPKFLYTENRARTVELPYALEKHIPVLPIMLEPGLSGEFSSICAKIQVVNKQINDSTATPYEDVLKTFLQSVLVGDELAQKVRNAFDAYVFLSYRKKDRRHAQRLMRLIHENKEFRDIAIWYDEFLVPGEGFNEAIKDAFMKSSLFALTVTPNLLEPDNYVMRKEYPWARERRNSKKDLEIVPVEMYEIDKGDSTTDKKKLEEKYREIPKVQDEHKETELSEAFVKALARIGRKENDGSPRHQFFIGLAYLNGIDVETNYGRALTLIESAATAKEPCFEATEKLVDMYMTGDGVKQDIAGAIKWQRTLVGQYRAEYEKHYSPDEHKGFGTKYFRALLKLSDLLRDSGDRKGSLAAAEEAMELSEHLTEEVGVRETERDTAVICNRLGSLYRLQKDPEKAEQYYRKAERIYARLAAEIGTARARRDLSIAQERLGDICRYGRKIPEAEQYYRKSYEIRRILKEENNSPGAKRDLSAVLTKLGNCKKDAKDYDEAYRYYSRALEIDEILAGELKTLLACDDYAVSLVKLGGICQKLDRHTEAAEYYDKAIGVYEGLIKRSPLMQYRRNYALSIEKLASASKHNHAYGKAQEMYEKAIQIREDIVQEKAPSDTRHELAVSYYNFGLYKEDREYLKKALRIWESLASRDPAYEKYRDSAEKKLRKIP